MVRVKRPTKPRRFVRLIVSLGLLALIGLGLNAYRLRHIHAAKKPLELEPLPCWPRQKIETSGFAAVFEFIEPWRPDAGLEEYAAAYEQAIPRGLAAIDQRLEKAFHPMLVFKKAALYHAQGDAAAAYKTLED